MVLPWMLHVVVVSTLLGVAGVAGEELARLYGKPRRWAWVAALAGSPLLAFGPWLLARLGLSSPSVATGAAAKGTGVVPSAWAVDVAEWASVATEAAAGGAASSSLAVLDRVATLVWPLASGAAVMVLLWSMARLWQRRLGWTERRIGGARVAVSAQSGPAVVGLLRPLIVVPRWAVRNAAVRRVVFRHESEHVRAGDAWLLAGACAVVALTPWNPASWWQARRLRAAVELDCDRRVLRRGEQASGYGRVLLAVADRSGGPAGALATLAEPRTVLERRIRAMTERKQERRVVRAAVAAVGLGAVVVAACDANAPLMATAASAATIQAAAVQSAAQAGAVHVRVRSDGALELNGRATTAETVMATLAGLGSEVPVTLTVDPRRDARNPLERLVSALTQPSRTGETLTVEEIGPERERVKRRARETSPTVEQQARELRRSRIEALGRAGAEVPLRAEVIESQRLQLRAEKAALEAVKLRETTGSKLEAIDLPPGVEVPPLPTERALVEMRAAEVEAALIKRNGAEPLFVVDGVIMSRAMPKGSLDVLDIEKIEVIKGAAAAKLYGERAANGVVSITTKRGGG